MDDFNTEYQMIFFNTEYDSISGPFWCPKSAGHLTLFQDKEPLDDKLPSSQCYHSNFHDFKMIMDFVCFYLLLFTYI